MFSCIVVLQDLLFLSPQARLQRGNLLLKQGGLDEAESDFKKVVSTRFKVTVLCDKQRSPAGVSVDL